MIGVPRIEPLHYLDRGSGPAVLLIHGGFSTGAATWQSQLRDLTAERRLLVPDRRGHGLSPREPKPYTIAQDSSDILHVVGSTGLDRFHVVGHSYGGLVAVEVALAAPGRTLSLHLLEPPYLALLPDDPEIKHMRNAVHRIKSAGAHYGPEWIAARFYEMIAGHDALSRLRTGPAWTGIVAEAERILDEEPPEAFPREKLLRLPKELPTFVYTGGRSAEPLRRLAGQVSAVLPGARLTKLAEAAHNLQTDPRFTEALLEATL